MIKKLSELLLQNKSIRQTILKNAFWLSFGELTGRILRTGIIIYATRVFGPSDWGIFSYATSLAALFGIFSDVGLSAVLIREVSKDEEARAKYFSTTFVLKTALTFISALAIIFLSPYFTKIPLSQALLLFVAILFIFDAFRGFGTSLFRATQKMEREAWSNIVTQLLILIAGFVALTKIGSVESLAAAYALGAGGGLLLAVYFLRSEVKKIVSHFSRELLKPIFNASWSYGLAGILAATMINTDMVLIGWFMGARDVGFYSAAQKPVSLLYILPSLLAGAFFPVLAKLANIDNDRFRRVFERGLKTIFFLALPLTLGIFLTARELMVSLYGVEYLPGTASLQILSLTLLTTFPISLIVNSIFAYNRQKELIIISAVAAISNALLDIILIPVWGINGSAYSTLITQVINSLLLWKKMNAVNEFSIFRTMKKLILATLVMGVIILLLQSLGFPLLFIVPLAILTYLLTLAASKETLLQDIKSILEG